MKNFRRLVLITAAVVATFIQGCGCDGKKRVIPPLTIPDTPDETETIDIVGVATKGIVMGASVTAHPIVNGAIDESTTLGTTTTDDTGSYVVSVDSTATNTPVVVRVSAAATGTRMKCDIPAGCDGGVAFGGEMEIAADSGFSLDTVVAQATDNVVANVSLLTDIATDMAVESIASGATTEEISQAIEVAKSRVADRFGITGDLVTYPVVDLTDTTAVAASDPEVVKYATLNAAIVAAVQQDDATQTVAEAITSFVTAYIANGVAGNTTDDSVTDLSEILAAAQQIITAVEELDEGGTLDLGSLQSELQNEEQVAQEETPDSFDQGTASPTVNDSDLDKVKAMVAVIRDIEGAIGESALGDGNIQTAVDGFDLQLDTAELATSDAIDELLEALSIAADAVIAAGEAYEDDNTLTSHTHDNVVVTIGMSGEYPSYTINQSVDFMMDTMEASADVAIVAVDSSSYTQEEDGGTQTSVGSGGYTISGTVENTTASLMIGSGSNITFTAVVATETDGETEDMETWSVDSIVFALDVTLMQKESEEVTDPISVNGDLSVTFTDLDLSETDMQGEVSSSESTATLDMASLSFGGEASNTSGASYQFSLSVTGETEGVTLTETMDSNGETVTHETAQNFSGAYASLIFAADLAGISSAVEVSYSVVRTGLEAFSTSLTIAYPGVQLLMSSAMADGEYTGTTTIVNQDGVTATVSETEVEGEMVLSGNITLDGTEYATIDEESAGVIIRYTDETFESL